MAMSNNKMNGQKSASKITNEPTTENNVINVDNIREEYDSLDSKLNEINSALDVMEQKNDDIHGKLKELLQSNIEIRQEFQSQAMQVEEKK